jgi:hypothetical protein
MAAVPPSASSAPLLTLAPATATTNGPDTVTSTPLVIGPVTFRRQECPAEIPGLGAVTQKLVSHEFTGGSRVVQKFGAQPVPVSWTGFLWQPYLDARVTTLQQLAVSGAEVPLSWRTEKWFAIVKDFDPGYKHASKTNYKITVEITRSANGALAVRAAVSVDAQVAALLAQANASAKTITALDAVKVPDLTPLMGTVSINVKSAGALAQAAGSPASAALSASIAKALGVANSYLSFTPQSGPTFVAARQLVSSLNLMQTNVTRGQSQLSVKQQGGSMYEMASTTYGDITRAFGVANFNNAVSLRLSIVGVTSIILPAFAKKL